MAFTKVLYKRHVICGNADRDRIGFVAFSGKKRVKTNFVAIPGENESRGMISAASRYISHQVVMSAWRRKPVVLFTILAITVLVLFVQYSQVGGDPKVPRLLDKQFKVRLDAEID